VEIEPGRYPVAGMGLLVARVKDVKQTQANEKGPGHTFVMVDAGFNDLLRPAMYGAYHHIEVVRRTTDELVRRTTDAGVRRATDAVGGGGADRPSEACVVAGPLCESGDVFTRDDRELVVPRSLPRPEPGDLLVLQDAGAYGAVMSSNYVSMGRVPQVLWDGGRATLMSRRETVDDIVRTECDEPL
jgi:diaminopimelate decarboxylase